MKGSVSISQSENGLKSCGQGFIRLSRDALLFA